MRTALTCALTLALAACATQAPPPPTTQQPASAPSAPGMTSADAIATALPPPQRPSDAVRAAFVAETAAKYGLDAAYIESVLARAQIRESTVTAMARPAETKPWRDYRPIFITPQRIDGGRAFLAEHRDQLARVEAQYGVPAEVIVAILGVETSWGGNTGKSSVLDALYTLAFNYPRTNLPERIERENQREAFFRDELAQLMKLGKETGLDVATLTGSYAGAMGWGQFMPSSYRAYAVDGDGDGKRDLFNDLDDVFASVANYFVKKGGWLRGQPVMVRAAYAPGTLPLVDSKGEPIHTLATLEQAGYRPLEPVPAGLTAAPIVLDGDANEYWLTFRNFRAIWSYNNSIRYATAVHQLAQLIAQPAPDVAPAPAAAPAPTDAANGQPGA
ncbi:lytic murein transglycosylase B [Lysobacter solisilvae (ex Woo and Kim 2020)]|uniref:Lytic murein transglycosylase B n=1 Tax=Agrilutibacter terrestris TaxID=2865112 RepID=A0A7H0FUH7_9GAMM|nr:lytic murein transglycosylase B [Lysobacter terrestris]